MSSGSHGSHRQRRRTAGVARPLVRMVGALLSSTLLVASGYFWLTYREIDDNLTRLGGVKVGQAGDQPLNREDHNILIVGNDDRSDLSRKEQENLHVGPGQGSKATDTMMLVHIPADGSRATLLSLPRDSYVEIPGHGRGRLNSVFVTGYDETTGDRLAKVTAGANLLIATVRNLTGLGVDRYAQIGLIGFYRIADALEGIPVTLCADVHDPKSGFKATKGRHTLDGRQALQFVRQRYNFPDGRGDLDRVQRQQYFLTAAFRKVASVGVLLKLRELGDALRDSLFLDSDFKILELAKQVQGLTADKIRSATIPTRFAEIDGQSVLRVDPAKVRRYVAKLLGRSAPTPSGPAATTPSATTPPASSTSATASARPAQAIDSRCTY